MNKSQLTGDDDDTGDGGISGGFSPPSWSCTNNNGAGAWMHLCWSVFFGRGLGLTSTISKVPDSPRFLACTFLMAETRQGWWEIKGQVLALPQAPSVTAGDLLHLSMPQSPAVNNTSFPLLCFCPCQFIL